MWANEMLARGYLSVPALVFRSDVSWERRIETGAGHIRPKLFRGGGKLCIVRIYTPAAVAATDSSTSVCPGPHRSRPSRRCPDRAK